MLLIVPQYYERVSDLWVHNCGGLKDGDSVATNDVLDTAIDHLVPDHKEIAPGVYRSADGKRQFRMTDNDLSKIDNHAGAPHVYIETEKTFLKPNGKESFVSKRGSDGNKHIFLPEEK